MASKVVITSASEPPYSSGLVAPESQIVRICASSPKKIHPSDPVRQRRYSIPLSELDHRILKATCSSVHEKSIDHSLLLLKGFLSCRLRITRKLTTAIARTIIPTITATLSKSARSYGWCRTIRDYSRSFCIVAIASGGTGVGSRIATSRWNRCGCQCLNAGRFYFQSCRAWREILLRPLSIESPASGWQTISGLVYH